MVHPEVRRVDIDSYLRKIGDHDDEAFLEQYPFARRFIRPRHSGDELPGGDIEAVTHVIVERISPSIRLRAFIRSDMEGNRWRVLGNEEHAEYPPSYLELRDEMIRAARAAGEIR